MLSSFRHKIFCDFNVGHRHGFARIIRLSRINKLKRELSLIHGSGCFFHDKMPGCCLPSLTAATALHFTAGDLKGSRQQ
jgi:hypothetical protein